MNGDRGFTLIEILVAIVVMAVALVVIMELFAGGLRAGRASEDYTKGILHAQAVMDTQLLKKQFGSAYSSGDFEDGYQWNSTITTVTDTLARIDVEITWTAAGKQKSFKLSSLKLVAPNETQP